MTCLDQVYLCSNKIQGKSNELKDIENESVKELTSEKTSGKKIDLTQVKLFNEFMSNVK